MARMLRLTNDEFEVLHDCIQDIVNDLDDGGYDDEVSLEDYKIYHIYQKLQSMGTK